MKNAGFGILFMPFPPIIETRMVSNGITDYELYTDSGTSSIIVRFPWKEDEKVEPIS